MSKHCKTHLEVQWLGDITYIHVLYKDFSRALCLIGRLIKVKWKKHLLHYETCVASIKSNHISKQPHWFSLFETMVNMPQTQSRSPRLDGWSPLNIFSFRMWWAPEMYQVPGLVYSFPLLKLHHRYPWQLQPTLCETKLIFCIQSEEQHTKQSLPLQRLVSKKFTSYELFS